MEGAGRDMNGVDRDRVVAKRIRKGECSTCGMKLFKQSGRFVKKKKQEPISIPGYVLEGRCLTCDPLDAIESKNRQNGAATAAAELFSVPDVLDVYDDDATVVSNITVDRSVFGRQSSFRNDEAASNDDDDDDDLDRVPRTPPIRPESSGSVGGRHSTPPGPVTPTYHGDATLALEQDGNSYHHHTSDSIQRQRQRHSLSGVTTSTWHSDQYPDGGGVPDPLSSGDDMDDDMWSYDSLLLKRDNKTNYSTTAVDRLRRLEVHREEFTFDEGGMSETTERHSVEDVASLLAQLLEENSSARKNTAVKVELIDSLTECVWDLGASGKDMLIQCNGVSCLNDTLWENMSCPATAKATTLLLLAMVAESSSVDDSHRAQHGLNNATTATIAADVLIDALLITMQSLIADQDLQEVGCRIFCCLASASGFHNDDDIIVNDGTLSGAVQSVLNAMDTHADSPAIQEWGTRALYHQCVYSANAEPNKRTLASATLDSGVGGSVVLGRVLSRCCRFGATDEPLLLEWCCQLYWVLSASADVAEMLSPATDAMQDMTRLLRELHGQMDLMPVQEAVLGALANFAMIEANRGQLDDDTELVLFVCDMMRFHEADESILHESCYLVAALAASSGSTLMKDAVVTAGGVHILLDILSSFSFDTVMREAALRALAALALGSIAAKAVLSESKSISCIIHQFSDSNEPDDDLACQEMCCMLLASVFAARWPGRCPATIDSIEHVCFAMNRYPDAERLQDAGCQVLRNLSCYPEYRADLLLKQSEVSKVLVNAMCSMPDATSIHASACCVFWNLKMATDIQFIVTTLQNHLEDTEVVLMACGSLWSLVHTSESNKEELATIDGGVDAIACVLMMHQDEKLLKHACGLLTSLTVRSQLVESVVATEGFSHMIDVMRSSDHGMSVVLLQTGVLFLRNVCLAFPEFSNEAARVISVVVQAMQRHADHADFQREACSFLWVAASGSSEVKSKILALDGVAVLMNTMERYSGVPDVEGRALGAFRTLTLTF
jgi:hypothetical protein